MCHRRQCRNSKGFNGPRVKSRADVGTGSESCRGCSEVKEIRQHQKMEGGQPAAMLALLGYFKGQVPQVPLRAEIPEEEPCMIKVLIFIMVPNQLQVDFQ